MEALWQTLKESLLNGSAIAWIIALVVLVLALKLLQRAGKGFVLLLLFIALVAVVYQFFPELLAPAIDFVRGGWLGEHRPFDPN
jgi:hypothetical protein